MRFKITTVFLFGLIFSGIAQSDTLIKDGKISLAILKIDFDTYTFEGGNMNYLDCSSCSADSFEFTTIFNPPMDFGDITFISANSQDTIFSGEIIWMGTGSISIPHAFETGEPYSTVTQLESNLPLNARFLDYNGAPLTDSSLIDSAGNAWNSIRYRSIISTYNSEEYQPVFYLYAPTVGTFDPSVAKWIVFLYTYQEASTAEIAELSGNIAVFPNPAQNSIQFCGIESEVNYFIQDMSGKIVLKGKTNHQSIDLSNLNSGFYTLKTDQQPHLKYRFYKQ